MKELIAGAVISLCSGTVSIVLNQLFLFWKEKREQKQAFFNNVFPERFNAYKKVSGAIAECGIQYIPNEGIPDTAVKEKVIQARQVVEEFLFSELFVIDETVCRSAVDFTEACSVVIKNEELKVYKKGEIIAALKNLTAAYGRFQKALRTQAGINLIDEKMKDILAVKTEKSRKPESKPDE